MLVSLFSLKGSPGVSSTALALAAVWPRSVVLLEADPAGGDLALRCLPAPQPGRGVVELAAADRGAVDVTAQAQRLGCGVDLVQGVSTPAQARGLAGTWPAIAEACRTGTAGVDVIADLGRVNPASPVLALARESEWVFPVATASLPSVQHLRNGLAELVTVVSQDRWWPLQMRPLLVGPDATGEQECAELDAVLGRTLTVLEPARPIPVDPGALVRLEDGESASGRLGRSLLLRAARGVVTEILDPQPTRGGA